MKNLKILAVLVLFLTAHVVNAAGLDKLTYTSLSISYGSITYDDLDIKERGVVVAGSFDVGSNVFIGGSYQSTKTDDFTVLGWKGSVKSTVIQLGVGYYYPLNPTVDFVSAVSVVDAKAEYQGDFSVISDEDDTGWSADIGLRALVNPHFEIAGGATYTSLYDDNSTSLSIGGIYYPADTLGLGVSYGVSDDAKVLSVGVRVLF